MRYKFRAYHKKKERLVDVLEINFEYNTVTLAIETDSDKEYYWWSSTCHLDEVELMQYIGLTDVNGRDIYEGDIFKLVNLHEDFNGKTAKIHWNEKIPGYIYTYINEEGKHPLTKGAANHIEIIGNIYQHKHLLKENE